MATAMAAPSAGTSAVDEEIKKYRALQTEVQALFSTKQQTLAQFNENTLVKDELGMLPPTATVYKLVGPALLKVDLVDARENVNKRLEYIEAEMTKLDNQIGGKQGEQAEIGERVSQLQRSMQEEAATAARKIAEEHSGK